MEEVNKLGKILIVDDNEDVLFALTIAKSKNSRPKNKMCH